MTAKFNSLMEEIRECRLCEEFLPCGPRPVLQARTTSRILIAGQAPGRKVHETGIPFDDPSGDRLRDWMGISREEFYNPSLVAVVPMGFCYPGSGKSGDLPPRPECAEAWRSQLMGHLKKVDLTLVIGRYAQDWHLGAHKKKTLTETVKAWRDFENILPLPHPSPRNNIWLRKNEWFENEVIPELQRRVRLLLKRRA